MPHRLEELPRKISWIEERRVLIGYHECSNCGAETPPPPEDVIIAFLKHGGGEFLWPGNDWKPPGWIRFGDVMICGDCATAAREALTARRIPTR